MLESNHDVTWYPLVFQLVQAPRRSRSECGMRPSQRGAGIDGHVDKRVRTHGEHTPDDRTGEG